MKSLKRKVRLEPLPKIKRRLIKLWSIKVASMNHNRCAVTGTLNGELLADGRKVILDAHHIDGKECNPSLRYDPINGVLVTKSIHKFGKNSFHRSPIWSMEWLKQNRPKQYAYVLAHRDDTVDLDDRATLACLEADLRAEPTAEQMAILGR